MAMPGQTRMTKTSFTLLAMLTMAATESITQNAGGQVPSPAAVRTPGELWSVSTVQEFVSPKDRPPSKPERQQFAVCYPRGTVTLSSSASVELPEELKGKCWLADQRTEARRQQTKFACNDGISAEVVTRQETDGSFGSQYVVNFPEKGGVSVTRTMRRMQGVCDAAVKPAKPANPTAPPAAPAVDAPAK